MIVYRIGFRLKDNEHSGYKYVGSKRMVKIEQRLAKKHGYKLDEPEVVEIKKGKKGMLAALNKYGGHPDNG